MGQKSIIFISALNPIHPTPLYWPNYSAMFISGWSAVVKTKKSEHALKGPSPIHWFLFILASTKSPCYICSVFYPLFYQVILFCSQRELHTTVEPLSCECFVTGVYVVLFPDALKKCYKTCLLFRFRRAEYPIPTLKITWLLVSIQLCISLEWTLDCLKQGLNRLASFPEVKPNLQLLCVLIPEVEIFCTHPLSLTGTF